MSKQEIQPKSDRLGCPRTHAERRPRGMGIAVGEGTFGWCFETN